MAPGADAVAQARALLGQLRTLAAQHEQVLAAYERQLDVITAGGASKLAQRAPNKRPLTSEPEGPEAKKQRLLAEQTARRNALWHECYKVLDRCRRNQKAEAFKKPVDPIRQKIPDYPTIVKNPMDLGTVGEKLKLRVYKDPADFAGDMRQIWDNAALYNGAAHPVGICALAMSEFFEKAWGPLQIEKQWAIQLQQEEIAREALQGNIEGLPNSDLSLKLKEKRDALGHFIAARDFNDGLPPGALGPVDAGRGMNFEEKRKLSAHLASLPGEKMQRVVDIVEAGMPPPAEGVDPEGELEIDIDALPDAVLWQLKEYVATVLAPPAGPPKKGGATKGGASKAPDKRPPKKAGGSGTPGPSGAGTPVPAAGGGVARGATPVAGAAPSAAAGTPLAAVPGGPEQPQQQQAQAQPEQQAGAPVAAAPQQQQQQQQQEEQQQQQQTAAPGANSDGPATEAGGAAPGSAAAADVKAEAEPEGADAEPAAAAAGAAPPAATAAEGAEGAPGVKPEGGAPAAAGADAPADGDTGAEAAAASGEDGDAPAAAAEAAAEGGDAGATEQQPEPEQQEQQQEEAEEEAEEAQEGGQQQAEEQQPAASEQEEPQPMDAEGEAAAEAGGEREVSAETEPAAEAAEAEAGAEAAGDGEARPGGEGEAPAGEAAPQAAAAGAAPASGEFEAAAEEAAAKPDVEMADA
ncbi:MAG: hypothetical protein J3K34DRAFT_388846 [Monoraphidium minutum]|nr:MAG: hypothetical protein J3K34DRAFT_388846 [Monoraphidium minutum]